MDNRSMDKKADWQKSLFDSAVLIDFKKKYVMKDKYYTKQDTDSCIICKIINYDENVQRMEIFRNKLSIIFLNIYPYQIGHLVISPIRHLTGFEEFTEEEILDIGKLTQKSILVLQHENKAQSFNIGWNQGPVSGGSIKHYHLHIVPRYKNELNFMEIIARTKPMIESLEETQKNLIKYQPFFADDKSIEELFS